MHLLELAARIVRAVLASLTTADVLQSQTPTAMDAGADVLLHFEEEQTSGSLDLGTADAVRATPLRRCKGGQFIAHVAAMPGNPYDGHIGDSSTRHRAADRRVAGTYHH
jgi:hypothetical protein